MSRPRKSRIVQRAEYALYRLVYALVRSRSDESLMRWGNRLGDLGKRVLGRRDRMAIRNLRATFPEESETELRRIADEAWRHFGREALLYVRMQTRSLEEIAARCPFVHKEILEEAIAAGRGTLLISAHFGGWEVGGLALMSLVQNVRTVARRLDNEYLERHLARLRASTGAAVIDRRNAARALMKSLMDNAVVVMLPDQAVLAREGILSPFFGRPAWTTDAPAKLALRLRSRIVFAFCIPDATGHRLEFEEPFRVDQLSDEQRDPATLTAMINDVLSRRIATQPELWLWMHDRWKGTGQREGEKADGE
jgi:KDO2-lipid IV(A) lauroyltransferase